MTNVTNAPGKPRTTYRSRLRVLLTTTLVALALPSLSLPALANSQPEPPRYGTPDDLNITLSGSYLSGRLATRLNDFASAAAFFEETLATDPDNVDVLERTFMLKLANGEIDIAMELAADMDALKVSNFLAHAVTAIGHAQDGKFRTASSALKADPGGGPLAELTLTITKAWMEAGAGEVDKALRRIDGLKGPEWFDVFKANHAALIAQNAGRPKVALERIEAAYNADRGALRVADSYARLLAANGRKADALTVLDEYDELAPGHPVLKRTRELIESGKKIPPLVRSPMVGIAELMNGLGSAIGRDGAEELAAGYLNLALYLDPDADFAAIALGGLYERMDNPGRAIEALEQVPDTSPLKRDAEIQVGLNYNAMDKVDESRAHLEALIKQDPGDLEAVISLGNVLRSRKMFAEAEKVYSTGIDSLKEIEPQHWALFYYRGICRERLKQWDSAEVDLRKALELYPDQPMVLNYLGYSLVDQGLKLDEALEMIKKAVSLRPSDGYIVDSLGWAYYRLGRYDEAVTELERAVELRPADPVINDHLGDAYWKVGRRLEAQFQWNHARDLDPEPEELPKILDKIANGLKETPAPPTASNATGNGG
ncbi:tetratricopeptide repeat protein [Pannonibacter tanglangensis]|uniref:Tetratricopeptide repeat protein n=1 Tax=Pannonibacter tanglangensis TaxID=2750084 RepID=A0ABW9ZKP4_9HYPH|nr:tetratricopeptide repeat protein [Pannonibacter sp. XCT-34]NBN63614.1 tetratricopeptide repeat protein [Pannonibacter sp. XCT-34]